MLMVAATFAYAAADVPPLLVAGCTTPEYRQLDFWLGDWDAFDSDEPSHVIARTHVELIAGGCAVHELYEQADGLIGDSILSFDAVRKSWQQTWVTNRGSLMAIFGNFKEGVLVMQGEVHLKDGRSLLQRITWKTEGSDVRESAVMSKDIGKTWQPAFDVLFKKHR